MALSLQQAFNKASNKPTVLMTGVLLELSDTRVDRSAETRDDNQDTWKGAAAATKEYLKQLLLNPNECISLMSFSLLILEEMSSDSIELHRDWLQIRTATHISAAVIILISSSRW